MRITIDDLRAFLAVAKTGSFIAAANELFITRPALSRRIKKLEDIVGERLIDRTTHIIGLTPTGEALLERSKIILRQFDDFHNFAEALAHDHQVKIDFASVWSAAWGIVPTLIRQYSEQYPKAEFMVHDANGTEVIRMVEEHEVDFGITTRPLPNNPLNFRPLCTDPLVLACPPQHPLYNTEAISWAELTTGKIRKIDWGLLKISAFGELGALLNKAAIPIPGDVKVQHLSTQIGFLEGGVRAAVVPALGASLCRRGSVRMIPVTEPVLEREIGIITRADGPLSKSAAGFVEFIAENFYREYLGRVEA